MPAQLSETSKNGKTIRRTHAQQMTHIKKMRAETCLKTVSQMGTIYFEVIILFLFGGTWYRGPPEALRVLLRMPGRSFFLKRRPP